MAKSSGGGKRTENPPPKTSPKVEREAGQAMRGAPATHTKVHGHRRHHGQPDDP